LTAAEIRARDPGWNPWRVGCPGGERPGEVGARADRVLALVPGVRHVLIFAHGHALRVMAARWLQLEPGAGALAMGAGAVSMLGLERVTSVVQGWNVTGGDDLFAGDALPGRAPA
jgi:probable phosphoglycerate mutase